MSETDCKGVLQIDRKEDIYQNYGLTFPHQDGPEFNHSNTILDGEMVIDVHPDSGEVIPCLSRKWEARRGADTYVKHMLRLLAFDLLVCDSENLMAKPLSSRYGVSLPCSPILEATLAKT